MDMMHLQHAYPASYVAFDSGKLLLTASSNMVLVRHDLGCSTLSQACILSAQSQQVSMLHKRYRLYLKEVKSVDFV